MIWDVPAESPSDPNLHYNPGNNDPDMGDHIRDQLELAVDDAAPGSDARRELERRYEYIDRAVGHMVQSEQDIKLWDPYPPESTLSLLNFTSPCNTTLLGPQGGSCSRLLQSN